METAVRWEDGLVVIASARSDATHRLENVESEGNVTRFDEATMSFDAFAGDC